MAPTAFVDVGSESLFPAARLPSEQDSRIGWSHLLCQGKRASDGRTAAYDRFRTEARLYLLPEIDILVLEFLTQALHILEGLRAFCDVLDSLNDPDNFPQLILQTARRLP